MDQGPGTVLVAPTRGRLFLRMTGFGVPCSGAVARPVVLARPLTRARQSPMSWADAPFLAHTAPTFPLLLEHLRVFVSGTRRPALGEERAAAEGRVRT